MEKKLYIYGLNLLAKRPYTISDFRKKLVIKIQKISNKHELLPTEKSSIEKIINIFIEKKYLNDANYCNTYINSGITNRNHSILKIKNKLIQKGVDKETINSEIKKTDYNEREIITNYINKRKSLQSLPSEKLIKRLLYQGFSYENIINIVN